MRHLRVSICLAFSSWQVTQSDFGIGLRKHDFAVLSRLRGRCHSSVREGRMQEMSHQLGRSRLVRIVAGQCSSAVREGLVMVRLLQLRFLRHRGNRRRGREQPS